MKPPAPAPLSPRRPAYRAWALAVAVLAAAGVAGMLGHRAVRLNRVQAALPAPVAIESNATLRDLLADARAQAERGRLDAVAELGRLYHANEFRREAEACWRLLIREQPGEARWHYYLADLLRTAGDQTAEEQELSATVAADPTAASAWLRLADMKFKRGQLEAAAGDYERRLALLPGDPYADLGLVRVAHLQGRTDEATQRLDQLLARHPKFPAAQNLYAELLAAAGREEQADYHRWLGREAGRFKEADDPWIEELNLRCQDPRRLSHLGVIAYQTAAGDRGRSLFEKAIALEPGYALAYEFLGAVLLEQSATDAARAILERGLQSAAPPWKPSAMHYLKLSEAYDALQQTGPSRRTLEAGLQIYPESADLLLAWGNQLKSEGQRAEAAEAYRRATEFNPTFVDADFALAILLLESERFREAVDVLNRILGKQPTFPKALLLLARLEVDAGRVEEAGRYLLPLLKANPGSPEIRQINASWRLRAGRALESSDPPAAEKHYLAGLALQPDHADLNGAYGLHLMLTERVAAAVPRLERFHQAQPSNPQAALFLGQAYARSGRIPDARRVLTAGLSQAERAGQTAAIRNLREILDQLPR